MGVVFELARLVGAFIDDPLLLLDSDFLFLCSVVVTDNSFSRIVVAFSDIVSSLRNAHGSLLAVNEESLASRSHTIFHRFSVESTIVSLRVGPLLVLELQGIIEEVLAFDELAAVPLGDIASLVKMNREG